MTDMDRLLPVFCVILGEGWGSGESLAPAKMPRPARPRRSELPLPSIVRMSLEMLGKGVDTAEQF